MKKIIKITAIILSVILILSSCAKSSSSSSLNKIKSYLEQNDYASCKKYVDSISADDKTKISAAALALIEQEYLEISENSNINDALNINLISKDYAEQCQRIWSIAKQFTPDENTITNENLIMLRYYYEVTNVLKYKELYNMVKDMQNVGYFSIITKALNDYTDLDNTSTFEDAKSIAKSFSYTIYDPQEYYITDMRASCEAMNKHLNSITNAFTTKDTTLIASSINNILNICGKFLYASDLVINVNSTLQNTLNTLKESGAFTNLITKITLPSDRDFEIGDTFGLEKLFPEIDNNSNNENSNSDKNDVQSTTSKADAVRILVNALNKTKEFNGNVTVTKSQNLNMQMTSFEIVSDYSAGAAILKGQINDKLNKNNGKNTFTKSFTSGACEGVTLFSFIPPANIVAQLDSSLVKSYDVVKGSGGYVITIVTTQTSAINNEANPKNVLSVIDPIYINDDTAKVQNKAYYSPVTIEATVSNSGYILKYDYSVSGAADYKFYNENKHVATGELNFDNSYSYTLNY